MIYFVDIAAEHLLTQDKNFIAITDVLPRHLDDVLMKAADEKAALLTCLRFALDTCYVFPLCDSALTQFKTLQGPTRRALQEKREKFLNGDNE